MKITTILRKITKKLSWEELKINVTEAVKGYYFDQPTVPNVKLHLVKNEILIIQ